MTEPEPGWQVILTRQPARILARLPADLRKRIDRKLLDLAQDPRPSGCKYLKQLDLYRLRVGDWRMIYSIEDGKLIILVLRIAPRGEAYRNL